MAQMRSKILEAYPGSVKWEAKVKGMKDSQVIAVYHQLKSKKRISQ